MPSGENKIDSRDKWEKNTEIVLLSGCQNNWRWYMEIWGFILMVSQLNVHLIHSFIIKHLFCVLRLLGVIRLQRSIQHNFYTGVMQSRTMDWFKTGKEVHQGCILSPCLFNLNACEMPGWMKHKLKSRLLGEYQ